MRELEIGSARADQLRHIDGARILRKAQYVAAATTGVMAVVSLVGWLTGVRVLASVETAFVPMAPLAAIVLIMLSALLVFRLRARPQRGQRVVLTVAGLVCTMVALEFLDVFGGLPVGLDRMFVTAAQGPGALPSVRMSPVIALAFLGLSVAFGLFECRDDRLRFTATNTSLLVAVGTFVLVLGHSFNVPHLYDDTDLFVVSLPAALGLLMLGLGIGALGVDCWPFALFAGDSVRAWLMRAIIPAAVLPVAAFVLVDAVFFHLLGLPESPLLVTMMVIPTIVVVGSIVLRAATTTGNRLDSAEEALRDSEERFRAMFSQAPLGIGLVDPLTGCFYEVNRRFAEIVGRTREQVMAVDWMEMTHPEDVQGDLDQVARMNAGEIPGFQLDKRYLRPDSSVVWVSMTITRLDHMDLHRGRNLCMIEDITERKSAQAELEQRGSQLRELLAERDRHLERLDKSLSSIIQVVSQVAETRDPYTAGHERRVSELAVGIAEGMGMSAEQIEEIRIAAMLHDIGKMSVPAEILSKPGALSPIEFELVKGHAESSYRIMSSADLEGSIAEMVYQHHERCDGSGYPRGLGAGELLLGARVLMVADVVEAIMSHRPYRASLGQDAALAEIEKGAGRLYDARVVEACLRLFNEGHFEFSPVAT